MATDSVIVISPGVGQRRQETEAPVLGDGYITLFNGANVYEGRMASILLCKYPDAFTLGFLHGAALATAALVQGFSGISTPPPAREAWLQAIRASGRAALSLPCVENLVVREANGAFCGGCLEAAAHFLDPSNTDPDLHLFHLAVDRSEIDFSETGVEANKRVIRRLFIRQAPYRTPQ